MIKLESLSPSLLSPIPNPTPASEVNHCQQFSWNPATGEDILEFKQEKNVSVLNRVYPTCDRRMENQTIVK